ncbi:MAG TPA: phosphodiester glycosidase family protein [Candidatus Rubrimentiphilum sp.]|nr:phosphodiester glycosidase family protein [Candidatus Rubrimentiphilum sp.]
MALIAAIALAGLLPLAPQPAAPFPRITTDAVTLTEVAPGVGYGDYEMVTADGPLSIHVLAIDLREPTVRLGAVLAQDRLISQGEAVSSMAQRSGAVAGINGDYFDINQTNQPLNILIQNGRLERMPMQRWAIALDSRNGAQFAEFSIAVSAQIGTASVPVRTINAWPPGNGVVLVTPDFGPIRAAPNVTELQLQPTDGTPPFATYRVTGIADNSSAQPAGYYLAIGPTAYGTFPLPNSGDAITIAGNAQPSLAELQTAIGGGPLLVKNGAWFADPDGPSGGELATRTPESGVAATGDGRLLFFEIDGRQPALSIGLLQPQLAALMIAFGATTGMQFDGGGSSTFVARMPGDTNASVQNSPSDGTERPVADGLFVYSDAARGAPARIISWPQTIRAFPGAGVPLRLATIDAGDHPAGDTIPTRVTVEPAALGSYRAGAFVAGSQTGDGLLRVRHGALRLNVPVSVTTAIARTQIVPQAPVVSPGAALHLSVRAFDRKGYPIALPAMLPWQTQGGTIDRAGNFRADKNNALVTLRLGTVLVQQQIVVGEHNQDLGFSAAASFATAPRGGPGVLTSGATCSDCLTLTYDFTGSERAAYANASLALPQRALGISADVFGDGSGETLRVAITNAINERFMYTIAHVTWHGWHHVEFRFPAELAQPLTLKALYVINRVGSEPPVATAGSVGLRNVQVILAGGSDNVPK